ncbi:MAG: carboxypeptidase regulatory-like domain-containing protein [Planctomycetes bacterium]|nr:carboxypeptidase regulatory-like domain-containing protein [Planctomycetota bacterium]
MFRKTLRALPWIILFAPAIALVVRATPLWRLARPLHVAIVEPLISPVVSELALSWIRGPEPGSAEVEIVTSAAINRTDSYEPKPRTQTVAQSQPRQGAIRAEPAPAEVRETPQPHPAEVAQPETAQNASQPRIETPAQSEAQNPEPEAVVNVMYRFQNSESNQRIASTAFTYTRGFRPLSARGTPEQTGVQEVSINATTDARGEFFIQNLPVGRYTMKFSFDGFRPSALPERPFQASAAPVVSGGHVVLEPVCLVSGKISDPGQQGIANASVRLYKTGTSLEGALQTASDDHGEFKIENATFGEGWSISVSAEGYEPKVMDEIKILQNTRIEVTLRKSVDLIGTIISEDGSPVTGFTAIYLISANLALTPENIRNARNLTLGPENRTGDFRFEDVPPGLYSIVVNHPEHRPFQSNVNIYGNADEQRYMPKLRRGANVSGEVRTSDRPWAHISGVWVNIAFEGAARADRIDFLASKRVTTNETGTFNIQGLYATETYKLTFSKPGFTEEVFTGVAPNSSQVVVLYRLCSASVQVWLDAGDEPPEGFQVDVKRIVPGGQQVHVDRRVVATLPTARISESPQKIGTILPFTNLPPGRYRFHVSAEGMADVYDTIELREGENVDSHSITLSRGGRIRGRLIDAETGESVIGAKVFLDPVFLPDPLISGIRYNAEPERTQDAGYEFIFREVPYGVHEVVVSHPHYASVIIEGIRLERQRREILHEVKLTRGGTVSGSVIGFHGMPISGACVKASGAGGWFVDGLSNDLGKFEFTKLLPGEYVVSVDRASSKAPMDVLSLIAPVTVTVEKLQTAEVVLGRELNDVSISGNVVDEDGSFFRGRIDMFARVQTSALSYSGLCENEGAFAFRHISADDYALRAGTFETTISVPVSGFTDHAIVRNGRTIRGRLFDRASGTPVSSGSIFWQRARRFANPLEQVLEAYRAPVRTNEAGQFVLEFLPEEELFIGAIAPGKGRTMVHVPAGTDDVVLSALDLVRECAMRVKVVIADGSAVPGAEIFVLSPDGSVCINFGDRFIADDSGELYIRGLGEGDYILKAQKDGFHPEYWGVSLRRGPPQEVTLKMTLALAHEVHTVRVVDSGGAPVTNAYIVVMDQAQRVLNPAETTDSIASGRPTYFFTNKEGVAVLPFITPWEYYLDVYIEGVHVKQFMKRLSPERTVELRLD